MMELVTLFVVDFLKLFNMEEIPIKRKSSLQDQFTGLELLVEKMSDT